MLSLTQIAQIICLLALLVYGIAGVIHLVKSEKNCMDHIVRAPNSIVIILFLLWLKSF